MGFGADHSKVSIYHIFSLHQVSPVAWGIHRKTKLYTSEFFFWQPTIGHIARFKVTEPHGTNMGQKQTIPAQSFTIKPEQVFQKLTT